MGNYLLTHNRGEIKNKYRIEAHMDEQTHDVPRAADGSGLIDPSYDDLYIACQYGNQIYHYGRSILEAYVPSVVRGNNILKELEQREIPVQNIHRGDEEISFQFHVSYLDTVAELLKAKTQGKGKSPYSISRYPINKNVSIPSKEIEKYKGIIEPVVNSQPLLIGHWTESFLNDVLLKKDKEIPNKDVNADMKRMCLFRQKKEYIYVKGYWDLFLDYMQQAVNKEISNNV